MEEFATLTVVGLVFGAIYAIAASGLVLTYTTSGIFNFAHGAQAMLSAFLIPLGVTAQDPDVRASDPPAVSAYRPSSRGP
mgnify:CR=1 FL=1